MAAELEIPTSGEQVAVEAVLGAGEASWTVRTAKTASAASSAAAVGVGDFVVDPAAAAALGVLSSNGVDTAAGGSDDDAAVGLALCDAAAAVGLALCDIVVKHLLADEPVRYSPLPTKHRMHN